MDLSVEEMVDGLLNQKALETPSDTVRHDAVNMELPPWYDEKEFNKARRFYWKNSYMLSTAILIGITAVFAVPSILKVLVSTRRSNSVFTAYKRYLSTILHTSSWFEHELKPGSISWKSLHAIRSRHIRASMGTKIKGLGVVSQRDISLTLFGFMGLAVLKPEQFGIRQLEPGDWEAYNHFWRTIGYMIGLEDRYNICRKTVAETRQVCQILIERVFTPCLENVPEYFEHGARVLLEGLWHINPMIDVDAVLYSCRLLCDVPGYIFTESERIDFQQKLLKHLEGKDLSSGVDSALLMHAPAVDGLPQRPPRLHYLKDYDTLDSAPHYSNLSPTSKRSLGLGALVVAFYTTDLCRWFLNLQYYINLFFMKHFPYIAVMKYGLKTSLVDIFVEGPVDDEKLRPNADYYNRKPAESWYNSWFSFLCISCCTVSVLFCFFS